MTREEFDGLVRVVEQRYAESPAALRRRVMALAIIGYAGLLSWLGIIILISLAFFGVGFWAEQGAKIACGLIGGTILVGGGYTVLRALLVRVPKPEGCSVDRAGAPSLFAVLDELQSHLRCPPFHQVLVEPVCNAAVVQVPRLGFFGWHRNYLLLGLPLLDGLSRDEMRAVLAHECSHLSRDHGRFSHWIYRLRRSWERVFERLSAPRHRNEVSLRPLLVKFVNLFWPAFNAHAFVFSRANEYEADADAAKFAGRATMALALVRLNLVSRHLEQKLWPDLVLRANEEAGPPEDTFLRWRDAISAGCSAEEGAKWLGEALQKASTNSDTHPCLVDRLRALEVSAPQRAPGPPAQSATEALLGAVGPAVRAEVQKRWGKQVASGWLGRHGRAKALKDRLNSLEEPLAVRAGDADRLWDKAMVVFDLDGGEKAKPLLREFVKLRPNYPPALINLGNLLLKENPADGVTMLERAMELDEGTVPQICKLLHAHYRVTGQSDKLRALDIRMDRYESAVAASQVERREVSANDTFVPHGLSETELAGLREFLARDGNVVRAYLVCKELKHFPNQRLFVLCVHPRRPWHGFAKHDADRALVKQLSQKLQLPGRSMVLIPTGNFRALGRKLERAPGSEVFLGRE